MPKKFSTTLEINRAERTIGITAITDDGIVITLTSTSRDHTHRKCFELLYSLAAAECGQEPALKLIESLHHQVALENQRN